MKRIAVAASALVLAVLGIGFAAKGLEKRIPNQSGPDGSTTLPNGWRITPAGHHVPLPGDLPMKIYATHDGSSVT